MWCTTKNDSPPQIIAVIVCQLQQDIAVATASEKAYATATHI
jgi:hypothetical protein